MTRFFIFSLALLYGEVRALLLSSRMHALEEPPEVECPLECDPAGGGKLHDLTPSEFETMKSFTSQNGPAPQHPEQDGSNIIGGACRGNYDGAERRLFLQAIANPYHGSTALEQLFMSSPKISTLCRAETWQCEGVKLKQGLFF